MCMHLSKRRTDYNETDLSHSSARCIVAKYIWKKIGMSLSYWMVSRNDMYI